MEQEQPYLQQTSKPTKWEECGREDLNSIPAMIKAGWTPKFHYLDVRHERTTVEHPPHEGVSFSKDTKHAWGIIDFHSHERAFMTADLIDGSYCNHKKIASLQELL